MVVVDIRNVFAVRNVEVIEISDDFIYYAEEKNEEGHNNLFLLEYNRVTKRERVVTHYSLDDPTFVQHLYSFASSIILVLENGGPDSWVFRVDKNTGEETARLKINLIGDFSDCKALDPKSLIIWTTKNEEYAQLFEANQEKDGGRLLYLYDVDTTEKYRIRDNVLSRISGDEVIMTKRNGDWRLLLLNPYGDETLKEKCYKNSRWLNSPVCDYIWEANAGALLREIKDGAQKLSLKKLVAAGTEGLARFVGLDESYLYFRARHFPTGSECICGLHRETGKVEVLLQLAFDKENSFYHVDEAACRFYRVTEREETCQVEGVLNSSAWGEYPKKLGEFIGCVEDRFLITRKVMNDSDGQYAFEYHSIIDTKKKTEESFECKCVISKNTLVLY